MDWKECQKCGDKMYTKKVDSSTFQLVCPCGHASKEIKLRAKNA
jgi:acetyl-CoA carboxylase beta subunit